MNLKTASKPLEIKQSSKPTKKSQLFQKRNLPL